MIRSTLAACVSTFVLFLAVGCGAVAQKPTATFKSANVGSLTEQGLRLDFAVDVDNPNSFELPIKAAKYKLGLGGATVLEDGAKPSAALPAKGRLPLTIPVTLSFDRLMSAEKAIAATGGNVPYQFDGELEFNAGAMSLGQSLRVPLNFNGTLALRDAIKDPVALMKSPAGRKLAEVIFGKSFLGNLLGN